jgi:hypothetical protein
MEDKKIILMRKQSYPFTVNYPFPLNNGAVNSKFVWQGTKGSRISELGVPIEVFDWLRDETTTFTEGMLLVKEVTEDDEELKELVNQVPESKEIENSILTMDEIKEMISTGNQNVLKGKLNKLVENLDEIQTKAVKDYIYRTTIEVGVDSSAKRKVICDWYGVEYEKVKDLFESEE